MNSFPYSDTNKRYHTLDYYNRQKYHGKVAKICLDADYTCPNRDGTKATGGCFFCPGLAVSGFTEKKNLSEQIIYQKEIIQRKWPQARYQLYWQSFSNTYASLAVNQENYALYQTVDNVVALAVATRPDCLALDTLSYLDSLTTKLDVTIELGLQSRHDSTRDFLNCQYSWQDFLNAVNAISKTNCSLVVHIINGLPYETPEMMLDTVIELNKLPIHGIKIHMLHIDKTTELAKIYQKENFALLSLEEYCDLVIAQLQNLKPEVVIHRLTGDGIKDQLIAQLWITNKTAVLNMIDKKMNKLNVYQGDLCETTNS